MRPSRAPWWLYIIAGSFLYSFSLLVYNSIWGIAPLGFDFETSTGSMIVTRVAPGGGAERAGLRTGDRFIAVAGIPIRKGKGIFDLLYAGANFESDHPIRLEVERQGAPVELSVNLRKGTPRDLGWVDWEQLGAAVFTFVLALVIGFRRSQDPVALVSAWLLAAIALDMAQNGAGWAALWRHQPSVLGLFCWPAFISRSLAGGICVTFANIFPRKLVRSHLVWILIWVPTAFAAILFGIINFQLVYRPTVTPTALNLGTMNSIILGINLGYLVATVLILGIQYRRLKDVNERRRMRVLFAGLLVACLAYSAMITLSLFAPDWFTDPIFASLLALYAAGPVALAYAVLRHRVLDLGLILRRGLQYGLARRALVSAVPILAVMFVADLLLHGDQPILTVFRARGWIYAVLAALAI